MAGLFHTLPFSTSPKTALPETTAFTNPKRDFSLRTKTLNSFGQPPFLKVTAVTLEINHQSVATTAAEIITTKEELSMIED